MSLEDITFGHVVSLLAVIVLGVETYNKLMTAWKNHRERKKIKDGPVTTMHDRLDAHDRMLKNDKDRLDEIEPAVNLLLKTNLVMLQHMIDGNGKDHMKQLVNEIQNFLIERK
ncbi:MAG: hypothetical protein IJS41_06115 [Clostridia bacterium]|nr:hypothetical protein [Clostridia bacterium]